MHRFLAALALMCGLLSVALAQEGPQKAPQESKKTQKIQKNQTNKVEQAQDGAKKEPVLLRWKAPKNGQIAFLTQLVPLQAKEDGLLLQQEIDTLIQSASAPIASFTEPEPRWLGNIELPFENKLSTSTYTVLRPTPLKKDHFAVTMTTVFPRVPGKNLSPRALIRAIVDKTGRSKSFYLPQKEKNILSLFLRLPKKAVREGDSWSIPFHFVNVPGAIHCKTAIQKSHVFLREIDTLKDGRKIAYIDYRIVEHLDGMLPAPPGHGHDHKLTLTMVFFGKARFDITKGQWSRLRGRLRIKQSGEWQSDYEQVFSLEPVDKLPRALRKKP